MRWESIFNFKRMMMKRNIFLYALGFLVFSACSKTTFLDKKQDNSLVVPATLADCQKLLDNDMVMNTVSTLGWTLTDDYVFEEGFVNQLTMDDRAQYTFASNPFPSGESPDWNAVYPVVFYANQVLEVLNNIQPAVTDQALYNKLRGGAHFFRAYANFDLVTTFAKQYDQATAATDPGIPLRKSVDIGEPVFRSSVADTYAFIEADMEQALRLLPLSEPVPTRPTRPAGYAFLARYHLVKGDYAKALLYSDSCLMFRNELMNYNDYTRFPKFNREVIFHATLVYGKLNFNGSIHPEILASYTENDLRGTTLILYPYQGYTLFMGSYTGNSYRFGGLATDEVYLTRAEAAARLGNWEAAVSDVNLLLENRMRQGHFVPATANSQEEAIDLVLLERRRELLFRVVRQLDLRRLNHEGRNIVVKRAFEGSQYELLPQSNLYTMPIPPQVIGFHPDMEQNPR